MIRIQKIMMLSIVLAVILSLSIKTAWAEGLSMADIAMTEYWKAEKEEPMGSDSIKYNEWYYGYGVSNRLEQDSYIQEYDWNAVFACWCADQLGYINRGWFPLTNSAEVMYQWFAQNGYQLFTLDNLFETGGHLNIRAGDVLFSSNEENSKLMVAIVTSVDSTGIGYVMGDVDGTVQFFQDELASFCENTVFVSVLSQEDNYYIDIVCFLRDRMNLNPAAVCGIVANILQESDCCPNALGDNGKSYGICQWHRSRWQDLINYCNAAGYDWTSLEGQLMFLRYELDTRYQDLKYLLMTCPTSPDGAYNAGYYFCVCYENPENTYSKAELRACDAKYNIFPFWYG